MGAAPGAGPEGKQFASRTTMGGGGSHQSYPLQDHLTSPGMTVLALPRDLPLLKSLPN